MSSDRVLKADHVDSAKTGVIVAVAVLVLILYAILGCDRDWVVIGGLLLDGAGAVLLATPDLRKFRARSYAGKLQQIYDHRFRNPEEGLFATEPSWEGVFLDEMDYIFGGRDVSEDSVFRIRELGNAERGTNLVLYHKPHQDADGKPMSVSNVQRKILQSIRREEMRIRRGGMLLLVTGFAFQIVGLLFDWMPFAGIVC